MPALIEDRSQTEVMLLLKAAIDTAITNPSPASTSSAIAFATKYPLALGSTVMRERLGQERWDWLNKRGIHAMSFAVTEPDVIK